jgi:predicted NUDIX family NTP pyrophosphohydrolase
MAGRSKYLLDSKALGFATIATWIVGLLSDPNLDLTLRAQPDGQVAVHESALEGLIDAKTARSTGAWWLDAPETSAKLSFAPEHDRLVWRVTTAERSVLLDAETGEALAFEFE